MRIIALECKPDEKLVMTLGVPRRRILHQNDKGDVCNFLKRNPGNIGLIDEDPESAQPRLISGFNLNSDKHGVRELVLSKSTLIMLCPRLEDWVLNACLSSNVEATAFGLPSYPKQLAKEINHKLSRFGDLILELMRKRNLEMMRLKHLLDDHLTSLS